MSRPGAGMCICMHVHAVVTRYVFTCMPTYMHAYMYRPQYHILTNIDRYLTNIVKYLPNIDQKYQKLTFFQKGIS